MCGWAAFALSDAARRQYRVFLRFVLARRAPIYSLKPALVAGFLLKPNNRASLSDQGVSGDLTHIYPKSDPLDAVGAPFSDLRTGVKIGPRGSVVDSPARWALDAASARFSDFGGGRGR